MNEQCVFHTQKMTNAMAWSIKRHFADNNERIYYN